MDQVSAEQDAVLTRIENITHVTRRVSRQGNCRQMIGQPVSAFDRYQQVAKTLQVRLVGKVRDGIVRDHDLAQVRKRFSTVARDEPVQMVEMRMSESDDADRGRIDACLDHRGFEMAK